AIPEAPGGRRGGMRFFGRKRLVPAAYVAAFIAAFLTIGALSRSNSTGGTTAAATSAPGSVPFASWYWTMVISATDPNVLVLGTSNGLYRSADGGKTWSATGPKGIDA